MRFIFGSFQIWCTKILAENTTFLVILGLYFIFNIFLNQSDLDIIIQNNFRRFCRLLKGGGKIRLQRRFSLPSSLIFSFEFSSWPSLAKLLYLVKGNGSLRINKTVRSNLFLLFNLCFEYRMFFYANFHDCLI